MLVTIQTSHGWYGITLAPKSLGPATLEVPKPEDSRVPNVTIGWVGNKWKWVCPYKIHPSKKKYAKDLYLPIEYLRFKVSNFSPKRFLFFWWVTFWGPKFQTRLEESGIQVVDFWNFEPKSPWFWHIQKIFDSLPACTVTGLSGQLQSFTNRNH